MRVLNDAWKYSTRFDNIAKPLLNWPRTSDVPDKTGRSRAGEWTDGPSLKGLQEEDIVQIPYDQIPGAMHSLTKPTTAGRGTTGGHAMYIQEEEGMKLGSIDLGGLGAFARLP